MFFEKMTKNHFCGGEANATSEAPLAIIFFRCFYWFFFSNILKRNNGYFNNFDFVQYSSDSQSFIISFFAIQFLWLQNFFSIICNTGLIDKKSKKSIFPHPYDIWSLQEPDSWSLWEHVFVEFLSNWQLEVANRWLANFARSRPVKCPRVWLVKFASTWLVEPISIWLIESPSIWLVEFTVIWLV